MAVVSFNAYVRLDGLQGSLYKDIIVLNHIESFGQNLLIRLPDVTGTPGASQLLSHSEWISDDSEHTAKARVDPPRLKLTTNEISSKVSPSAEDSPSLRRVLDLTNPTAMAIPFAHDASP